MLFVNAVADNNHSRNSLKRNEAQSVCAEPQREVISV